MGIVVFNTIIHHYTNTFTMKIKYFCHDVLLLIVFRHYFLATSLYNLNNIKDYHLYVHTSPMGPITIHASFLIWWYFVHVYKGMLSPNLDKNTSLCAKPTTTFLFITINYFVNFIFQWSILSYETMFYMRLLLINMIGIKVWLKSREIMSIFWTGQFLIIALSSSYLVVTFKKKTINSTMVVL
jgi:hypothetical protein